MNQRNSLGIVVLGLVLLIFPYLPSVAQAGPSTVQLTFNLKTDIHPAVSADGARVAFSSDEDGDFEIYIINADGTGRRQLTFDNPADDSAPSISGDGSRIAFESDMGSNVDVCVVNSDGSGWCPLVRSNVFEVQPSISSNGLKVAFASNGELVPGLNPEGDFEIFVVNYDGSGLTQLTRNSVADLEPSINADGTRVAFQSKAMVAGTGDFEIWIVNSDGTGLSSVTNNDYDDTSPSISSSGGLVAFQFAGPAVESPGPTPDSLTISPTAVFPSQIYVANSDGSGLRQVSMTGGENFSPSLSGDGGRVAYVSTGDGDREIVLVNSDGSGLIQITSNSVFDIDPSINNTGDVVVFSSDLDGDFEIYAASLPAQCSLQGDVNKDGTVNILDLVSVGAALGKRTGDPGFNPNADLNNDGVINILDLVIVGSNFGKSCPP